MLLPLGWSPHTTFKVTWLWGGVLFEAIGHIIYIREGYCFSLVYIFKMPIKSQSHWQANISYCPIWTFFSLPKIKPSNIIMLVITYSFYLTPELSSKSTTEKPRPRNHVLQVHIWLRGCPQSEHLIQVLVLARLK